MEVKKPEVSIIVLAYNQEKYIRQTMESVVKQEHDFSIEILANDDASTDSTGEIIEEYARKYPDIVIPSIAKTNIGAMNSYYALLNKCEGKYIMSVAGDDYWLPGKIKAQYEFMESHLDVGLCYGKEVRVYEDKSRRPKISGDARGELFEEILYRNPIPALTTCRRKDLNDIYMKEIHPENRGWLMEDYPMWLWYSKHSKIHFIDQEMGVYRVIKGSLSHPVNLEDAIRYAESARDVGLFFAGDEKKYVMKIERNYCRILANAYLRNNDIKMFRLYNKRRNSIIARMKNAISYMPFGKIFLKDRL